MANSFNPNPPTYPDEKKFDALADQAQQIITDMNLTGDESKIADLIATQLLKHVAENMRRLEQDGGPTPRLRLHKAAILRALDQVKKYPD